MAFLTTTPLQVTHCKRAVATQFQYDREGGFIRGCIYNEKGNIVALSQRVSGVAGDRVKNNDPDFLDVSDTPNSLVEEESVYMGHFMGHYGHFITEGISSFWALKHFKNAKLVFHPFLFGNMILPYMEPFFQAFEVSLGDIHIIREPTIFNNLLVPERTFHLNSNVNIAYADIISDVLSYHNIDRSLKRRIYLSRTQLETNNRGYGNQSEVDDLMQKLGFEIIHPQNLTILQQMQIFSHAQIMAGFSGSALHNAIFMKRGGTLIEIGDTRNKFRPLLTQQICNEVSNVKQHFISTNSPIATSENLCDLINLQDQIRQLI